MNKKKIIVRITLWVPQRMNERYLHNTNGAVLTLRLSLIKICASCNPFHQEDYLPGFVFEQRLCGCFILSLGCNGILIHCMRLKSTFQKKNI